MIYSPTQYKLQHVLLLADDLTVALVCCAGCSKGSLPVGSCRMRDNAHGCWEESLMAPSCGEHEQRSAMAVLHHTMPNRIVYACCMSVSLALDSPGRAAQSARMCAPLIWCTYTGCPLLQCSSLQCKSCSLLRCHRSESALQK